MLTVYNNWGHYDELGDTVRLTEALVQQELDTLERWRRELGVAFEVFVIDCLWFEPALGYRHFRAADWPNGPGRVFERIRALGMTPGLWFSTSGGRLNVPAWEDSLAEDKWHHSLADGPYADALEDGFMHAAEEWGVRYFKLDFADLRQSAKGVVRSEQETMRRSVERLRAMIRRVRDKYPDAYFITHCGFARRNSESVIGSREPLEVDPGWLDTLNAMFSGDPHCTDIPQTSLARNIDLYQDRQVWKLHQSGFPLHRIEDHGAVMGLTNTAMYRGRTGVRRTHLGQLARGGRRDMLYGDPTVLTDDDVRAMQAARTLFADAFEHGLWTRFVGPGEPGVHPWHAYLTGGGASGLLYLVNSSLQQQTIELPLLDLHAGRVLFHDGRKPAIEVQPEHLTVELGPEQLALMGLGTYADARWELPPERDVPPPVSTRVLSLAWQPTVDGMRAEMPAGALAKDEQLLIVAQAFDAEPAGALQVLPFRFARQDTRTSADRTPQAHKLVSIECEANGTKLAPVHQVPDVPVWSGISWVARVFAPRGACTISVKQTLEPARRLRVSARAVRYAG